MEEFKNLVHQRFNIVEDRILDIEKRIDEIFMILKLTEATAKTMNEAIEKIQGINKILKSNERDIRSLAEVVSEFEANGIKSNSSSGEIDYDLLVKKLVKANRDIIQSEIQFALKQKK